jgi:hypothetical protein
MTSHALDLAAGFTESPARIPKRQRTVRRPRSQAANPRRRNREPSTAQQLREYWDRHAVKTGMVGFYAWFMLANWTRLHDALSDAAIRFVG